MVAEEKQREKELERLIQQEVESAWQKRIDQWRTERFIRRKLMDEVIAARSQQIQERCEWSPFAFCLPDGLYFYFTLFLMYFISLFRKFGLLGQGYK